MLSLVSIPMDCNLSSAQAGTVDVGTQGSLLSESFWRSSAVRSSSSAESKVSLGHCPCPLPKLDILWILGPKC